MAPPPQNPFLARPRLGDSVGTVEWQSEHRLHSPFPWPCLSPKSLLQAWMYSRPLAKADRHKTVDSWTARAAR
jgi:hypothetical protein